jgi:type I restriction enzyme S subunit
VVLKGSGSTVAHLRVGQVFDIPLAYPPTKDEQSRIVLHLELENTRIDHLIKQERMAITLIQEFRSTLVAEVVTGKVKV